MAYPRKSFGVNRFFFKNTIDMLLRHTYSVTKFCFSQFKLIKASLDGSTDVDVL